MKKDKGFREAFAAARKKGQKTFTYKGKRYSTQTAAEKARKMTDKQLEKASDKAHEKARGNQKSKSIKEIAGSYMNEIQYRMGDKLEKQGLDPTKYSDRMKGNFRGSAYAKKRPSTKTSRNSYGNRKKK